jgi:hypothetical protein
MFPSSVLHSPGSCSFNYTAATARSPTAPCFPAWCYTAQAHVVSTILRLRQEVPRRHVSHYSNSVLRSPNNLSVSDVITWYINVTWRCNDIQTNVLTDSDRKEVSIFIPWNEKRDVEWKIRILLYCEGWTRESEVQIGNLKTEGCEEGNWKGKCAL